MRVLAVTMSISRIGYGVTFAMLAQLRRMQALGHEVEVLALDDAHAAEDQRLWDPIRTKVYPRRFPKRSGHSRALMQELDRLVTRDAVCHLHGLWLHQSHACRVVSKRRGLPRVVSPHGMLDPWAMRNLSPLKKRLFGMLCEYPNLRTADCLHAVSWPEVEAIRSMGFRAPIAVIPNGIEIPATPEGTLPDPAPREWEGHKVLLSLGRIHPQKGLLPLVQAWSRAGGAQSGWKLAIIGPDELDHVRELKAAIEADNGEASIQVFPPQFGMDREGWLRRASAFALTSFSEGLPLTILEAATRSLPILMSPQCNFPIETWQAGAMVAHPNPDDIAEKLRQLFALREDELREMGQAARAIVEREHSWDRITEQLLSVYGWLLGATSRPADVVFA